jgi:hypothetical protein
MMMENRNSETVRKNQGPLTRAEESERRGVRLEAREFERLLQRASEVLKVREQGAA